MTTEKPFTPGPDTVFVDEAKWPKPRWSSPSMLRDEFARFEAQEATRAKAVKP